MFGGSVITSNNPWSKGGNVDVRCNVRALNYIVGVVIQMKMDYIAAGSYVCVLVGVLVGGQPSGEKGRGR